MVLHIHHKTQQDLSATHASALPRGLLRVVVSKPCAGKSLQTAAHEQFQASVKVAHTDGCEKTELHVEFAEQVVDGCGAEDGTGDDAKVIPDDAWMEVAADFVVH